MNLSKPNGKLVWFFVFLTCLSKMRLDDLEDGKLLIYLSSRTFLI